MLKPQPAKLETLARGTSRSCTPPADAPKIVVDEGSRLCAPGSSTSAATSPSPAVGASSSSSSSSTASSTEHRPSPHPKHRNADERTLSPRSSFHSLPKKGSSASLDIDCCTPTVEHDEWATSRGQSTRLHPLLYKQVVGPTTPQSEHRLSTPQIGLHWGVLMPLDPALPLLCLRGSRVELCREATYLYAESVDEQPTARNPRRVVQAELFCYNKGVNEVCIQVRSAGLGVFVNGQQLSAFKYHLKSGDQLDLFIDQHTEIVDTYVFHWVGLAHSGLRPTRRRERTTVSRPLTSSHKINWRQGKLIGSGEQGNVYIALDKDTGVQMAVKTVHISPVNLSRVVAIEREIKLCLSLSHEKIVKYYGADRRGDELHILMELVPGGSTRQLLDTFGAFSENVVRIYMLQLLIGLEYLHQNDVVHGDIKGSNMLVTNTGTIKIADFGSSMSQLLPTSSETGGTVCWMAPEAISELGSTASSRSFEIRKKGDIWSVGCTMLEMLTGKIPWSECGFERKSLFAAILHIGKGTTTPHIPYSNITQAAADFLHQCFHLRPEDRPDCSELLAHPFLTTPPEPSTDRRGSQNLDATFSHPSPSISPAATESKMMDLQGMHSVVTQYAPLEHDCVSHTPGSVSMSPAKLKMPTMRVSSAASSPSNSPLIASPVVAYHYGMSPIPDENGIHDLALPDAAIRIDDAMSPRLLSPSPSPAGMSREPSTSCKDYDTCCTSGDEQERRELTASCIRRGDSIRSRRTSLGGVAVHASFTRHSVVQELTNHAIFAGRHSISEAGSDLLSTNKGDVGGTPVLQSSRRRSISPCPSEVTDDTSEQGLFNDSIFGANVQEEDYSPHTSPSQTPIFLAATAPQPQPPLSLEPNNVGYNKTNMATLYEQELLTMTPQQLQAAVRHLFKHVTRCNTKFSDALLKRSTISLLSKFYYRWFGFVVGRMSSLAT